MRLKISGNRAIIPTGLLIEKWLLYYYPIFESSTPIPQINGGLNLAFSNFFMKVVVKYKDKNGFSSFYNDLKNKGIPESIQSDFLALVRKLYDTITKMSMKYIGRSISNEYYSIFTYEPGYFRLKPYLLDIDFLISTLGTFSIAIEYYNFTAFGQAI